jgi:hypothetical protein
MAFVKLFCACSPVAYSATCLGLPRGFDLGFTAARYFFGTGIQLIISRILLPLGVTAGRPKSKLARMLFFFDESFRQSETNPNIKLGALCGINIPESNFTEIANDVYKLKLKHFGADYASEHEIKGKELLKNFVFKLESRGMRSRNLEFSQDLLEYIRVKGLKVFGCVCFEQGIQDFKADDSAHMDRTFLYLFERVDMFMKIHHPKDKAILVFDDRDQGINGANATAITKFFQRSASGIAMDSIIPTPFTAISQAQSVGVQLADFVTAIIGIRFSGGHHIKPFFAALRPSIFEYKNDYGTWTSGVKVMRAKGAAKSAG